MSVIPEKWDIETEVVVVGWGGAGSVTAITAKDAGSDVLILEKMPEGGGNSRVSGGNLILPKSATEFANYLKALAFNTTDDKILEMFAEETMKHVDFIKELGGDVTPFRPLGVAYPMPIAGASFPKAPGAQTITKNNIKGDMEIAPAMRYWRLLKANVEKRGIKVMTKTAAKELVQNSSGEIIGVIAENEGKTFAIKAKKAVVMTCGGFENDPERKWDALPCRPTGFLGNPGNTGDGLRMTEKVGASMWHMTGETVTIGFQAEGYEAAFFIIFLNPGFIYVDKYGKRFLGETEVESHDYWRYLADFDTEKIEHPRVPFYAIFDEQTRNMGPINASTAGYNPLVAGYKWSIDNSEEIKKGWIIEAKSPKELAGKIGMDPAVLEETVNRWNDNCKNRVDPDFGRPKHHLRALEGKRYYAVKLYPVLMNTCGGPKRDIEARILDSFGKPIPRLYASGEFGSIWGFLYQGANSMSEGIVFGKIAGRNAHAEKPWG